MTDSSQPTEVTTAADHAIDGPAQSTVLSDQLGPPDAETADYLGRFNIDMGTSAGGFVCFVTILIV
ncbi:hypothetical protein PHET_10066 [Paragonimus heterotremus]|uniref:Uncharacterized protein n=1 Tax=Paragonimus heterotremus TaxID=100268 RepID=A0A8J4SGM7_9TREM|nr:hypothetical protein PHET_10066 [Paragonimus heterotremus]